jgi:hypothetical protein
MFEMLHFFSTTTPNNLLNPPVIDQLVDRSRSVTRQVVDKNPFCFIISMHALALP